uniref:Aquaporin n=1 Tax=Bursaphelenchus xylophilus TaxID=6326 RepID=A0A1I7S2N4_BURXY
MSKSKAVAAMPEEEAGEGGFGNKVKIYLKEGNTEIMGNGEERPYSLWSKLVAEFIGDLIFIFIGSISVNLAQGALINIALAHGLAIFVLVSSLGHIR